MSNGAKELSSIDFEAMLGGPLVAVINAQAQAAMSTVNFIKEVGFKKTTDEQDMEATETGEPIYVTFQYPKETKPYEPKVDEQAEVKDADGNVITPAVAAKAAVPAVWEIQKIRVPILTILPIPFIRIDETTIDFNAKINSMHYKKTDSRFQMDTSLSAKYKYPFVASVGLKVNTSYQRNTQQGSNVKRTYSMAVHIKAVQDEMPAGMERMLGILEDVITAQPISIGEPTRE